MPNTVFFHLLHTLIDTKGDALAHLAYGVLDTAMVETAMYVVEKTLQGEEGRSIRVLSHRSIRVLSQRSEAS